MKRYYLFALSLLAISTFAFNNVSAQTTASSTEVQVDVIADLSVRNIQILEKTSDSIKVSFDLINKGQALSDVVYGFEFMAGSVVADFKQIGEPLSLATQEKKTVNVTYVFPNIPTGTYSLSMKASALSGMPLVASHIANIEIPVRKLFGIIPESCVLRVGGEPTSKTYTTTEGVDVLPSEKLFASCDVINGLSKSVSLIPFTETFLRNRFGPKVSQKVMMDGAVNFASSTKKNISIEIEKPSKPQAYDTLLSFTDGNGSESNTVAFHYVIRGKSATIQSIALNKGSYVVGEDAGVLIRWTASADSFPGSRLGAGSTLVAPTAIIKITANGVLCAPEASRTISKNDETVNVAIQSNCNGPKLEVSIKDGEDLLSKLDYQAVASPEVPVEETATGGLTMLQILVGGLAVLVVLIFLIMIIKKKKTPSGPAIPTPTAPMPPTPTVTPVPPTMPMTPPIPPTMPTFTMPKPPIAVVALLIMAGALLFSANKVDAATVSWRDTVGNQHQATVDLTQDSYVDDQNVDIDVNFDSWYQWCTNGAKRPVYFGYVVKDSGGNVVSASGNPSQISGRTTVYDPNSKGALAAGSYTVKTVFGSSIMVADEWTTSTCEIQNVDGQCIQRLIQQNPYQEPDESQCTTITTQSCQIPSHYSLSESGSYGTVDLNFSVTASPVTPPVNVNNTNTTVTNTALMPEGFLDTADCTRINGWTVDKNSPGTSLQVHVYKNGPAGSGTIVGGYNADQSRPDVNSVVGVPGNHGYWIPLPDSLRTGQDTTIYVYAIGVDANGNTDGGNSLLGNSPKTINCAAPVVVATKTCWDNSVIPVSSSCPVVPPATCQDPSANNVGSPLPCTYPATCQDSSANNFGAVGACTYSLCQDPTANNQGSRLPCTYSGVFSVSIRPSTTSVTLPSTGGSSLINIFSTANVPANQTLTQHGIEYRFNGGSWQNGGAWNSLIANQEQATNASFPSTNIGTAGNHEFRAYGSTNGGASYYYTSPVLITSTISAGPSGPTGPTYSEGGYYSQGGYAPPPGFTVTSIESSTAPIQFLGALAATSTSRHLEVNPVNGFTNPVTLQVIGIRSKANGAGLPAGITAIYTFDEAGPTAVMNYNSSFGRYTSQRTGLIGSEFRAFFSKPITEPYEVTVQGVSSSLISTYIITIDPSSTNPAFIEI